MKTNITSCLAAALCAVVLVPGRASAEARRSPARRRAPMPVAELTRTACEHLNLDESRCRSECDAARPIAKGAYEVSCRSVRDTEMARESCSGMVMLDGFTGRVLPSINVSSTPGDPWVMKTSEAMSCASEDRTVAVPAAQVQATVGGRPVAAQVYAEAVFGGTFPSDLYGSTSYSEKTVPLTVTYDQAGRATFGAVRVPKEEYYGFQGVRLILNPRGQSFAGLPGADKHLKRASSKTLMLTPGEIPATIALDGNDNLTGAASPGVSEYGRVEPEQIRVAVTPFLSINASRWVTDGRGYSSRTIPDGQWECLKILAGRGEPVSVFGRMEEQDKRFLVEDVDDATLAACGRSTLKQGRLEESGAFAGLRAAPAAWDGR